MSLVGRPFVVTVAVMARYNPFFERAGMTRVAESRPDPKIMAAMEDLKRFEFRLIFLSSEEYNLGKLRPPSVYGGVKEFFIRHAKTWSALRKRLISANEAYVTVQDFCDRVTKADPEKLARMLRVLNFITQRKVYLIWQR